MITTALITLASYVINAIVLVLPQGDGFPAQVDTAVNYFAPYLGVVDPLLPIDTLHTIVLLVIGLELAILSFKMAKWLFGYVPFIGGK